MKVTCGTCAARYSLRFKGARKKLLKLRCQRCAAPIVVVHPGAEGAIGGAAEERYYLAIAGGQSGPLPLSEIRARLAHGELPEDTHLWRKGWEDWVPIEELDALLGLGEEPTAQMTTTGREVTGGYEWAVVRPRDSSPAEPIAEPEPARARSAETRPTEAETASERTEPEENEATQEAMEAAQGGTTQEESTPEEAVAAASEESPPRWPSSRLVFGGLGALALAALVAFAFLGGPEPSEVDPSVAAGPTSHHARATETAEASEANEAARAEPRSARASAPEASEAQARTPGREAQATASEETGQTREEAPAPLASAEQARQSPPHEGSRTEELARARRPRPERSEPARLTPPARPTPPRREPAIEWPPPAEPGPTHTPAPSPTQGPTRGPAQRVRTPVPPNPFGGAARPAPEIPDWPTEA